MSKEDYSPNEYMAIQVSRVIRETDKMAGGGVYSDVIYNGVMLASILRCPDLIYATGGFFMNLAGKRLPRFTPTFLPWEYRFMKIGEGMVYDHDAQLYNPGPRKLVQGIFFIGGMQIDRYGNINNTIIGDIKKPRLRGPGTIGIITFSDYMLRSYMFVRHHDRRTFVPEVDFITAAGYKNKYGEKKDLKVQNEGPEMVITPIALMDFDEETKHMRLKSVHPGYTVKDVVANTGFDLIIPDNVPTTSPPTEEELYTLRNEVDRLGVLRKPF